MNWIICCCFLGIVSAHPQGPPYSGIAFHPPRPPLIGPPYSGITLTPAARTRDNPSRCPSLGGGRKDRPCVSGHVRFPGYPCKRPRPVDNAKDTRGDDKLTTAPRPRADR